MFSVSVLKESEYVLMALSFNYQPFNGATSPAWNRWPMTPGTPNGFQNSLCCQADQGASALESDSFVLFFMALYFLFNFQNFILKCS